MSAAVFSLIVLAAFLCGVFVGGSLATVAMDAQRRQDEARNQELHLHDQIDQLTLRTKDRVP